MPFNDYGFKQVGSFLMSLAPDVPTGSLAFGIGNSAFDTTINYLNTEIQRKVVTWTWFGEIPKGTVTLLQTEANGSNIQELGLVAGASVGSDASTRDLSSIGLKDASFSVNVSSELRINRS